METVMMMMIIIIIIMLTTVGQDSSVGTTTHYGVDGAGIESR
jgi:hypothetical protein